MKTLGQRIRELREEKDFSLREFGNQLGGLSPAFLSDIELGRRFPSDKVLKDMARALNVSMEELKKHDSRAPVEDLKRLSENNPAYGMALRQVINSNVSPEDLIKLANRKEKQDRKS